MNEHYYFDNAATSWPKPESVYQFMDAFYRSHGVNPGRSGYALGVSAEQMVAETRRLLAAFFGFAGSADRVVFTQNATDSLNLALRGLLESGDHVVTTRTEHNSVLRPLYELQSRAGVDVSYLRSDDDGYVDPVELRAAIRRDTRCVVINHASNVLGTVQDIDAIGNITRDMGTLLIVDSCQTAGVIDIDMAASGIDLLAFTGHKGLFGPMGVGGLIVSDGVELVPARSGGTGVDSVSRTQPQRYPHRLEAGTIALPAIAGLNAAQKWFAALGSSRVADGITHKQAVRAAVEHIHQVELAATQRLAGAFRELDRVKVYGPPLDRARVATLPVNIGAMPATQVGEILDADHHICVRAGLHCAPLVHEDQGTLTSAGMVRFSPGFFTSESEVDHAIDAVRAIALP